MKPRSRIKVGNKPDNPGYRVASRIRVAKCQDDHTSSLSFPRRRESRRITVDPRFPPPRE